MKFARIACIGLLFLLVAADFSAAEDTEESSEKNAEKSRQDQKQTPAVSNTAQGENAEAEKKQEKNRKQETGKPSPPRHILYLDAAKTIKVDLRNKTLEIPAKAEIITSLIELALCYKDAPSNRAHESSFVTKARPSLVHAGLNLIGLKEGKAVEFEGQNKLPTGDGVHIFVPWKDAETGAEKLHRLEHLIFNDLTREPLDDIMWIFGGGNIIRVKGKKDMYEADEEGTIISTWHHPAAVIDIPLPEGSDDTVFYSYKKRMPPKGTNVTFIFSPGDITKNQKQNGPEPADSPKKKEPADTDSTDGGGKADEKEKEKEKDGERGR